MFITFSRDGNGDLGFILSKTKECKRVQDLKTDESTQGYATFKVSEEELYGEIIEGNGFSLTKFAKQDGEWETERINPIEEEECNED